MMSQSQTSAGLTAWMHERNMFGRMHSDWDGANEGGLEFNWSSGKQLAVFWTAS